MASALPTPGAECCIPSCDDVAVVQVPGAAGVDGEDGAIGSAGVNAFTFVTTQFTQPAAAANVVVQVGDSSWMAVGQKLFIQNGGYYEFVSSTASTNATLKNLGYTGNVAPTTAVAVANKISPGGIKGADGAAGTSATTPVTTKGDLLGYSTVAARLAVGTNKRVLTADSAQTLGLAYKAIDLTGAATEISGALPIANGGTGQTAKQAAFNALSPVSVRGDLIIRDATNNVALAIGTTGKVLTSNGTDPSWNLITPANINMASGPLPRYGLLGMLTLADFSITTDQPITIQTGITKYIIRKIVAYDASTDYSSGTVPLGGIYSNAAKAGTVIVAATQSYASLTAATKFKDLTLEAVVGTDYLTATTLYFSLTTAHASGTGTIAIWGENIT